MKINFPIKNERITRVIIGMPSSCDITSYIGPDDEWGATDCYDNKKITFEDVDDGIIYFNDEEKFYKIGSLEKMGYNGIEVDSLYGIIKTNNLIC